MGIRSYKFESHAIKRVTTRIIAATAKRTAEPSQGAKQVDGAER